MSLSVDRKKLRNDDQTSNNHIRNSKDHYRRLLESFTHSRFLKPWHIARCGHQVLHCVIEERNTPKGSKNRERCESKANPRVCRWTTEPQNKDKRDVSKSERHDNHPSVCSSQFHHLNRSFGIHLINPSKATTPAVPPVESEVVNLRQPGHVESIRGALRFVTEQDRSCLNSASASAFPSNPAACNRETSTQGQRYPPKSSFAKSGARTFVSAKRGLATTGPRTVSGGT